MIFHPLCLAGAYLIEPEPFIDPRGTFRRHFCAREFAAHGLDCAVLQGNVSENPHKGTLRGLHYQVAPHQEAKTISAIRGSVYAVVADIRPWSATYLRWQGVTIGDYNRASLHVPVGCAAGILTLEDNTILQYYVSQAFNADSYRGIRWNDPAFGFAWPEETARISDRDRGFPDYRVEKPANHQHAGDIAIQASGW